MKKITLYSFALFILLFQACYTVKANEVLLSNELDLSQYHGKVVYLDFWASWCVPCRKSFPWMNQLQEKYGTEKLVVIAVNLDKEQALAEAFLTQNPATFRIIYDPKSQLAKKYQIKGMPSSIIFDPSGRPVIAHTGFFTKKIPDYNKEIEQLILK
jgi:thiol-disulfide isomerase/thioredoxin